MKHQNICISEYFLVPSLHDKDIARTSSSSFCYHRSMRSIFYSNGTFKSSLLKQSFYCQKDQYFVIMKNSLFFPILKSPCLSFSSNTISVSSLHEGHIQDQEDVDPMSRYQGQDLLVAHHCLSFQQYLHHHHH